MAKRGATEQITKDTWERDEDQGGRDRSEEPAEIASQAVLAKRKILKPKSRVSGASSAAPTSASPGVFNFGQSAPPAPAGSTSLFGQPQAATPARNNIFGSVAAAPSTTPTPNPFAPGSSQKTLFPGLFGTPAQNNATLTFSTPAAAVSQGNAASQPASNMFGSTAGQANAAPKPAASLFGTPAAQSAQVPKPSQSLFSTPTQLPNGTTNSSSLFSAPQVAKPTEPRPSLFGFPSTTAQKTEDAIPKPSTTPTATPTKPSSFNMFGDAAQKANSTLASNTPMTEPSNKTNAPMKPLFGTPQATEAPKFDKSTSGASNLFSATNATKSNNLSAQAAPTPNSNSLFSSPKPSAPATTSHTSPQNLFKPSAAQPEAKGQAAKPSGNKVDPTSVEPPAGSGLTREQMPMFNWLYQVRCLNNQFLDKVQQALSDDPYTDLSTWANFYQTQIASFTSLRASQQEEVDNGMSVDSRNHDEPGPALATPSKASKIFESALGTQPAGKPKDSSEPANPPAASSLFQTTPSTGLFGQAASNQPAASSTSSTFGGSLFPSAATKPAGLFGNKAAPAPAPVPEAKPASLFQFGAGNQTSKGIFDSNPSKDSESNGSKLFTPNSFAWNSKSNSAVPSNASSPGSVLASGTAGMKDVSAGGWSNPFTQENPLFITKDDDDDDEDDEEGEGEGEGDENDAHGDEDVDVDEQPSEENTVDTASSNANQSDSIFSTQPASSGSSLFGRVTSTPSFNFGQSSAPKTGAVGLFGSTTAPNDTKTWTPEKGIIFGNPAEGNKNDTTTNTSSSNSSIFGGQATTGGSLFGNSSSTSVPSFNFSMPTNGKSIFSNPPSKPATPPVLFGGPSGGLAPPAPLFGGPSPAPSDISTPGETSNKEGGEDENEPSDEAGQVGNTKDLSGRGPGEEDEDEVFEARSSIYNLVKGAYVKIGIGRLRVLKNRNTFRSRIVVKVETGKVLMNVALRKELDYARVSESEAKGKVVKVIEFLQGGESRVWVMKVGTVELAQKLRKTLEENK
ncbi:Ran-binding protein 3 [Orbilia brochopaga]|uniref:Ran-binding protein 3 n=1 Tax=Orbilia brochopaga TaxID=3140254 RepID=A0AAV9UBM7_9PEZI